MVDYFKWERMYSAYKQIMPYLFVTFQIVFWATLLGVILGLIISQITIYKVPALNQISMVFISFMRGTPLIVQLMICYYGLPMVLEQIGVDANRWDKLIFAFIAYGLNEAAFLSEMFRASILAVPAEQTEAALSIGLTKLQTIRRIILPQMVRIVTPTFSANFIGLFQGTSLVYLLGIMDVMGRAKAVGAYSSHYLEPYLIALAIYVVISVILSYLFRRLEGILERRR